MDVVLRARADLGEGPVWDADRGSLLWVDITAGTVHRFDPRTGEDVLVEVGQAVGAVASTRRAEALLLALRDGFGWLDLTTSRLHALAPVEAELPQNRMNDGKCDSRGRFWAGTQSLDHSLAQGALYRLELDGSVTTVLTGVSVSNGIGWSPDDRSMYYVDTMAGGIDRFDFEPDTGCVRNRRRLVDIPDRDGLPDGLAVDEDGCIWLALWGGGEVRRFDAAGRRVGSVPMPVRYPTSCAFGGSGLDVLYVTSARRVPGDDLGGSLLAMRPGVTGPSPQIYRGTI